SSGAFVQDSPGCSTCTGADGGRGAPGGTEYIIRTSKMQLCGSSPLGRNRYCRALATPLQGHQLGKTKYCAASMISLVDFAPTSRPSIPRIISRVRSAMACRGVDPSGSSGGGGGIPGSEKNPAAAS